MAIDKEVIDKIAALMTAAFGLVAALAWNEAIQSSIKALGLEAYGPWLYAIIVTVIAVVATIYIGRVLAKAGSLQEKVRKEVAKEVHKK